MLKRIKHKLIRWFLILAVLGGAYYAFWGRYLYLVTAYCDCPICINVSQHYDHRFASGKPVYWGGVAADSSVPFGSHIELVPHMPQDWLAVMTQLKGRRQFTVEDRGGKIKGRHIDLFFSKKLGGHQAARRWGARWMRIRLNGELAK